MDFLYFFFLSNQYFLKIIMLYVVENVAKMLWWSMNTGLCSPFKNHWQTGGAEFRLTILIKLAYNLQIQNPGKSSKQACARTHPYTICVNCSTHVWKQIPQKLVINYKMCEASLEYAYPQWWNNFHRLCLYFQN